MAIETETACRPYYKPSHPVHPLMYFKLGSVQIFRSSCGVCVCLALKKYYLAKQQKRSQLFDICIPNKAFV